MPSPPLHVSCTEHKLLLPNIAHYLGTDWKRNSGANTILIIAFPSSTNMPASGQLNLATGLICNRKTYECDESQFILPVPALHIRRWPIVTFCRWSSLPLALSVKTIHHPPFSSFRLWKKLYVSFHSRQRETAPCAICPSVSQILLPSYPHLLHFQFLPHLPSPNNPKSNHIHPVSDTMLAPFRDKFRH